MEPETAITQSSSSQDKIACIITLHKLEIYSICPKSIFENKDHRIKFHSGEYEEGHIKLSDSV